PRDSTWLVVSVYPKSLERREAHIEVRFRVFEGFVEEMQVAAVSIIDRRRREPSAHPLDSFDLRAEGIEFQEEGPGSGAVVVSALDARTRKDAANSGRLELAEFVDKDLGFVNLSWSARGVAAP
ncbi:MAG: hypothetical protein HYZ74_03455, partial [Elusimicrobia bacterium]|nr:hypothetical protein [Elusimicrobiota bacterium]